MMALYFALKCLNCGPALAMLGDSRNDAADYFLKVGRPHVLPLYGQELLVGFETLKGKIAPHLVRNHRARSGNAGHRRCNCRPAEPRAEIECRRDPDIEIDAEPAAEGDEQARQSEIHRQAGASPPTWYSSCRGRLDWRCRDDTPGLNGRD